jgi:hypothetical protein
MQTFRSTSTQNGYTNSIKEKFSNKNWLTAKYKIIPSAIVGISHDYEEVLQPKIYLPQWRTQ